MIIKNIDINVNNDRTTTAPTVVLYKGDSGLLLNLTLKNFKFNISTISRIDASVTNEANDTVNIDNLRFNNNIVTLQVGNGYLVLNDVGKYRIHLHIYDENNNRISVPSFSIDCKDTIY